MFDHSFTCPPSDFLSENIMVTVDRLTDGQISSSAIRVSLFTERDKICDHTGLNNTQEE